MATVRSSSAKSSPKVIKPTAPSTAPAQAATLPTASPTTPSTAPAITNAAGASTAQGVTGKPVGFTPLTAHLLAEPGLPAGFANGMDSAGATKYAQANPFGNANDLQQTLNNTQIQQGNRAYQEAVDSYNGKMQAYMQNGGANNKSGLLPPALPGPPESYYHSAINATSQYAPPADPNSPTGGTWSPAGVTPQAPLGQSTGGLLTTQPFQASSVGGQPAQAPAGGPGANPSGPALPSLPIQVDAPSAPTVPNTPYGGLPQGSPIGNGSSVPTPSVPTPVPGGGSATPPGQAQPPSPTMPAGGAGTTATAPTYPASPTLPASYGSANSPTSVGATGQVGPPTTPVSSYSPTAAATQYGSAQPAVDKNGQPTTFPAPFVGDISDSKDLTKRILSTYDTTLGGGAQLLNEFGQTAAAQQNRAAQLQQQLATAYAPIAAGNGGYTPTQAASILQQPGLDSLPTTASALQGNFLTPEEQANIAWTPQNTQDLEEQAAASIQAGTQAQKDSIQQAAQRAGVSSPLQVQAMQNRAQQAGLAASGEAQTQARLQAGQMERQQALTLAQNRQTVNQANQGTQYSQGMDINQLESGRNKSVADTNVAAGQEYRNQYLGGQEQQATQAGQVGQQQQLGAYTSQAAGTNQANQVGVSNEATPTLLQKILGFAKGGVAGPEPVHGPKPALVGEAGPEAIVPLAPPRLPSLRVPIRSAMPMGMRGRGARLVLGSGMDRVPARAMATGGVGDDYVPLNEMGQSDQNPEPSPVSSPPAPGANTPTKPATSSGSVTAHPGTPAWRKALAIGLAMGAPRFAPFAGMIAPNQNVGGKPASVWAQLGEAAIKSRGGRGASAASHLIDSGGGQPAGSGLEPSAQQSADTAAGAAFTQKVLGTNPVYPEPNNSTTIIGGNRTTVMPSIGGSGGARQQSAATPYPSQSATPPVIPWGSSHSQSPDTRQTRPPTMSTHMGSDTPPGQPSQGSTGGSPIPTPPPLPSTQDVRLPGTSSSGITFGDEAPEPETPAPGDDGYQVPYYPLPRPDVNDTDTSISYPGIGDTPSYSQAQDPYVQGGSSLTPGYPGYGATMGDTGLAGGGPDLIGQPGVDWTGGSNAVDYGVFAKGGVSDGPRGQLLRPPVTPYGPTRIVNEPTFTMLGANQPEAVVPLTKRKDSKVVPSMIPALMARYARQSPTAPR